MINEFCVPILLDVEPLTKPYNSYGTNGIIRVPLEDISTEFTDFLLQRNIKISFIEVFYNPPFKITPIHVDGLGGDYAKINFIYGGPKSFMCWYNTDVVKTEITYTHIKTRSIRYEPNEVTLVHRQTLHSPSIVQVGVPHNIINTARERWCVSVTLAPVLAEPGEHVTFNDAVNLLQDLVHVPV